MILVIPNAGLTQLVASSTLLAATWPGACEEIKLLIQVLRMSWPSLAEALALGVMSIAWMLVIAALVAAEKLLPQSALATGATAIAAGNPGCAAQLDYHFRALGRQLPIHHPVELVWQSIAAATRR